MTVTVVVFTILTVLTFAVFTNASPCGKSGMTVVKADDGRHFVIYSFRKTTDVAFQLPGRQISFPTGTSGPKRFIIDGIFFETLFARRDEFIKPKDSLTDLEILNKHREYEVNYLIKTGGRLTKFVELGPRPRRAVGKQPEFVFYLWKMVNPSDASGARQYYLTTVSDGEVFVLTAVVPDDTKDESAMEAFTSFAGSFQHILSKDQCPSEAKQ